MLAGGQVADCTAGATLLERLPDCDILHGEGLRQQRDPPPDRGSRRDGDHSAQGQSQMEKLLFAVPLSQPQRHRTRRVSDFNLRRPHFALRYMTPAANAATLTATSDRLRNLDQLRRSLVAPTAPNGVKPAQTLIAAG
jgi:hypothetical protein